MTPDERSDETLMRIFQQTLDEDAFRVLASRYYEKALRIAELRCGDAALAQDAVQEALLRVVRHRRRYRPAKPFAPWFLTILRNVCSDMYRKRVRHERACAEYETVLPLWSADAAAMGRAEALVSDLPAEDAELLELRYVHGFTLKEVAGSLGCSLEAAKKRVQRILQRFRG